MPSSNICWGIEVGSGSIKAVKLESDGASIRVVDFAVVPHAKVLSTPDLDQADALRVALGALASRTDLSGASIAVSVPGHAGFARFAKLPPVEPKKVPDIVKFEAVQQIPFPLEDVEWDYQTFVSPDSPDVEVGIFAITKDRIRERIDMLADVGIVPQIVTLGPVAAYNALAYDLSFTEETTGTILLDIGTTSTDLVIADAGRVWIRTFPIGGHQFTLALMEAFKLTYPKAEKVKREADTSKAARQIMQAMRPVFGDLVQDVQRSIGYYQSLHRDSKLTRLIGLGSTFNLPGLRKFLKQQLQLDVYRIEEFKRISFAGERAAEFNANAMTLATAYGCALQGLGQNAINANLMPTAILRTSMWKAKQKWFATAAGLALAATGAMFIRPFLDTSAIAGAPKPGEIDQVMSQFRRAQSEAQSAGVLGAGSADLTAANLLALFDDRAIYPNLANDLGLMIEAANAKATKGTPAIRIISYNTSYLGVRGGTAQGDEFGGSRDDDGGGRVASPYGNEPAAAGPAGAPAGPTSEGELRVATPEQEPLRFYQDTVSAWLFANASRPDVPYIIVPPSTADVTVIPAAPLAQGGAPGGARPGIEGSGRGDIEETPGRGGRVSGGGRTPAGRMVAPTAPMQVVGEGTSRPDDGEEQLRTNANALLTNLAPLEATSETGYPGEARVRVRFNVVLKPKTEAGPEGDA
jgi:type IV pilus assembly protein PilM